MKIIYVENVRIPSERAHAYQIVQTCSWLAKQGHEVVLVNPDRAKGKTVFEWFGLPPKLFQHVLINSWDPLSSSFPWKALTYVLQRMSFVRALRRWAKQATADVWYTRDPAMIDALRGVVPGPWILESHDNPSVDPARWSRVKELISGHVAISRGMADRLKELDVPSDAILVASDGYDPDEFKNLPVQEELRRQNGVPEGVFVALYAGSFYPWKGVELVVTSWDKMPKDWHLILMGGPAPDHARVEALVPTSVRARVHFLALRPHADAMRVFPMGDVGLLTSSSKYEIGRRYTSPLKQFEYLAAGLPILASDVPSSHEVLDERTTRFFQPTSDAFVSALQQVWSDKSWRASASKAGPELVKKYTWEARTQSIVAFIKTRI